MENQQKADARPNLREDDTDRQRMAETNEQISDDYFAGGNEVTFLRDGKDLSKSDGFRPK